MLRSNKKTIAFLIVILTIGVAFVGISMQTAWAQGQGSLKKFEIKEVYYPSNSPNAAPQPAPLEYFWENVRIEEFPTLAVPPQPNNYCWDEKWYGFCDCINRLYWEYWCQRCCNHPDYCPTGCCTVSCWWTLVGTCSCK